LKDLVFETVDSFLEGPRERYRELMADVARSTGSSSPAPSGPLGAGVAGANP